MTAQIVQHKEYMTIENEIDKLLQQGRINSNTDILHSWKFPLTITLIIVGNLLPSIVIVIVLIGSILQHRVNILLHNFAKVQQIVILQKHVISIFL